MSTTDKRQVILQALEKELKGRRYDEVTVDQIAKTAGVGKGTVYRYFKDKDDLFFQMVQEFLKEEIDAITVVAISSLNPIEKIIGVGEVMSMHIHQHGQYIRMMHAPHFGRRTHGPREIMGEHHDRLNRLLTQIFTAAENEGFLREGLDHQLLLCAFKGIVMERSMQMRHLGTDLRMRDLLDLLLDGIGTRA